MNRLAGIISAVIGLVFVVLSLTGILPGFTVIGVAVVFLGGLIIGLSFVPKPTSEEVSRMPTAETLTKIFYAPTEVFQNLRRHPRWLAAVIVMTVISAVYSNAFVYRLTPERVVGYSIDKTKEMPMMNDQAKQKIEEGRAAAIEENSSIKGRVGQAISSFVGLVFWTAFLAIVFFLLALVMGGKINYWQAFSAAAYSMFPVWIIGQALNLLLLFLKDPDLIHPILGRGTLVQDSLNFLVTPSENPVLYSLLGMFGIFTFYQIWMRYIGLKNTGERVTSTVALTAALAIWILGMVLSASMAFMFPSFLS